MTAGVAKTKANRKEVLSQLTAVASRPKKVAASSATGEKVSHCRGGARRG